MTMLDRYIIAMRSPVWLVCAALILLLCAARGLGELLLSGRRDGFCKLALGVAVLALARLLPWSALPYSGGFSAILLLYPAFTGARTMLRHRLSRVDWLLAVILAAAGVFTVASAFLPPYGWDEQVYQTALWMRFPGLPVIADNPYSAYSLLPQFFLEWGRAAGGLELPRLMVWALTPVLAGKLFLECSRRCGRLDAGVLSLAVMLSPASLVLQRSFYAETFVAVFALAGWLTLEQDEDDRISVVLSGIFAGACVAVKLTGIGAALMLAVRLAAGKERRHFGWFVLGALLIALPFYLRPWLFWGNPVYPFGSALWGTESAVLVERFFRDLGTYRYGLSGVPGVALGWLFACFHGSIYDGVVCGFGILAMVLVLVLAALLRRTRAGWSEFAALFSGYLFWALSSQQTRFLYPLFFPAALALSGQLAAFPKRRTRIALSVIASGTLLSFPEILPQLKHHLTAWRILPTVRQAPAEFLARVSGGRYVNSLEKIARTVPKGSRVLLLFERRTLYLPAAFEHGTPFFQEKRLTPPPATPDELFSALKGFDYVLMGSASGLPDHLEKYDEVERTVFGQLLALARSGRLRLLSSPEEPVYPLFEVVHER